MKTLDGKKLIDQIGLSIDDHPAVAEARERVVADAARRYQELGYTVVRSFDEQRAVLVVEVYEK